MKNAADAPWDASLTVSLGLPSRDSARGARQCRTKGHEASRDNEREREQRMEKRRVGLNGRAQRLYSEYLYSQNETNFWWELRALRQCRYFFVTSHGSKKIDYSRDISSWRVNKDSGKLPNRWLSARGNRSLFHAICAVRMRPWRFFIEKTALYEPFDFSWTHLIYSRYRKSE